MVPVVYSDCEVPADVDVVVTCFNSDWSLEESIASLQRQTIANIRIIVVDDGSTDGTPDTLARLSTADPRIHVVRQQNAGVSAAANAGLGLCNAPFIARQDADDLPEPHRLEQQLSFLRSHADCVAISAAAHHIDKDGRPMGASTILWDTQACSTKNIPAREPYLLHSLLMVRTDAFFRVGGYRNLLVAEDTDLFWRLREHGRLVNRPECLGSYRFHAESISSRSIRSGRHLAIYSQLAALSAQRRSDGRADVDFDGDLRDGIKRSLTLTEMIEVVAPRLSEAEMQWFAPAVSAKLLELCTYRPFLPDKGDCRTIASCLAEADLTDENWVNLRGYLVIVSAHLMRSGRLKEAATLTRTRDLPALAWRVLLRTALPRRLHNRLVAWKQRRKMVAVLPN